MDTSVLYFGKQMILITTTSKDTQLVHMTYKDMYDLKFRMDLIALKC